MGIGRVGSIGQFNNRIVNGHVPFAGIARYRKDQIGGSADAVAAAIAKGIGVIHGGSKETGDSEGGQVGIGDHAGSYGKIVFGSTDFDGNGYAEHNIRLLPGACYDPGFFGRAGLAIVFLAGEKEQAERRGAQYQQPVNMSSHISVVLA